LTCVTTEGDGLLCGEHDDPVGTLDLALVRHLWRLWYQIPMALPVIGPRMVGDPKGRYLRMLPRS
jgi:hypothetical protein